MSRYPFTEFVCEYLDTVNGVIAPRTYEDVKRRYNRQSKIFIQLKNSGMISSSSPQRMTADDIRTFLVYRKNNGASATDLKKDLTALRKLCDFCDNTCVKKCLTKYPALAPRAHNARLPSMPRSDYQAIIDRLPSVPREWHAVRAYALVSLFLFTGTRTRELRLARTWDIDTDTWELEIVHPKGEGTYGEPRTVPIPPFIRGIVQTYLDMRKEWVAEHKKDVPALFPSHSSADGHLSANSLRIIRLIVEDDLGINFDFRMCRRTFGQRYIDANLNVESVSVLMGHASTKTTEGYYCRQKNRVAIENAKGVWKVNPTSIEKDEKTTGLGDWCSHRDVPSIFPDSSQKPSISPDCEVFTSTLSDAATTKIRGARKNRS